MNKKTLITLFLAAAFAALFNSGCNTIHGAGQDISHAGHEIQEHSGGSGR